jgi:hypothetical protein
LAQSHQDLQFRLGHWKRAISLMEPGIVSLLGGEGFGQYPIAYLLKSGEPPTGTFAILSEEANPFLRLGAGEPAFLDQSVAIEPNDSYRFSARVRQPSGSANLQISLCEKALLYSFHCEGTKLERSGDAGRSWQNLSADIRSDSLGAGGNWPHPPVKISLHNAGPGGAIDLDDLSLKDPAGRELLGNGDFSEGAKRWLFVTDQDLAWHIHEQWVELFFAQGLLGLLAMSILLPATARSLWPPFRAADPFAVSVSAALAGILAVGLLGSVLDTARVATLVYLGALLPVGMFPGTQSRSRRHSGKQNQGGSQRRHIGTNVASDRS